MLVLVSLAGAEPLLKVSLPTGSGQGSVKLATSGSGMAPQAEVRFYDGRAELARGEVVDLPGRWRREGDTVVWTGPGLQARVSLATAGDLTVVAVQFAAEASVWVRAELQMPLAFGGPWRLFDGRSERDGRRGTVRQQQVIGTFPALAAFDNARGVGVGLDPTSWVSTFEPLVQAPDGKHGYLGFSVPLALDAGRPETVRFVLGAFQPGPFGVLPLLEAWHAAFPTAYQPAPKLDPRLARGCATGAADYAPQPGSDYDARGICEGAGSGWEWKYAKFKFGGDVVGRPETWGLSIPAKAAEVFQGSLAEFLAWRRANFAFTDRTAGAAPMFYLINWVSDELRSRFEDSLIAAADAFDHRGVAIQGWIHTFTTDHRAYPWNNGLGDQLVTDLAALRDDLPLAGFAHDVAVGGSRYRPSRYESGRAYDPRGVWLDEGLGIARVMHHVHSLRASTGEYGCGNAANFFADTHYAIAAATDTAIYEGGIYDALAAPDAALRDRLLLGRKPRCWYVHTYRDDIGLRVPFEGLSGAELQEIVRARWDTAILWSFRFGWLPSPDLAFGYAPMQRALPLVQDCVQAGWHAVPAMTTDQPVWLARYGDRLNTRLVVMNPHDNLPRTVKVKVWSAWLGGGPYLFASADGQPTENQVDGRDVSLTLTLPPRSWQVFHAVGRHGGGPATVTVRTVARYDPQARPAHVGVLQTHLPQVAPFRLTGRYAPTQEFYEQAGLVRQELP